MSNAPVAYAYIISIAFDPAASSTLATMYREQTAPLIANSPGLVSLLGLMERSIGRGLSIRSWRTLADRARSDAPSQAIVDDLSAYGPLLTGTYTRDPYDVVLDTLTDHQHLQPELPAVALVTIESIQQSRWDEGSAALRTHVTSRYVDNAREIGAVLFENRALGRGVLIEVARLREHLNDQMASWDEHDLRAHTSGYLITPTDRTIQDVVAWY